VDHSPLDFSRKISDLYSIKNVFYRTCVQDKNRFWFRTILPSLFQECMREASWQKDVIHFCHCFVLTRLKNILILDAQRGLQGGEHRQTSCKCVFTFQSYLPKNICGRCGSHIEFDVTIGSTILSFKYQLYTLSIFGFSSLEKS
jgi:hypothetical protein